MGFHSTTLEPKNTTRKTPSCAQKTASRNFFTYPIKTQYKNRSNSLKTSLEKPYSPTKTASGVFYYKYRHYAPELGRWPSRDPIEESGGINLYAFVGNDGVNYWDILGLAVNATDGLSFWESVEHFYTGGGAALTTDFSAVDPGWEMKDLLPSSPCEFLTARLAIGINETGTAGISSVDLTHTRQHDLFQFSDIANDVDGNSGPGVIDIDVASSFLWYPPGEELSDGTVDISWNYGAYLSAQDNMFDFDPKKGARSRAKEAITRATKFMQNKFGAGKNFNISFEGGRSIDEYGVCNCCLTKNKKDIRCKKK